MIWQLFSEGMYGNTLHTKVVLPFRSVLNMLCLVVKLGLTMLAKLWGAGSAVEGLTSPITINIIRESKMI